MERMNLPIELRVQRGNNGNGEKIHQDTPSERICELLEFEIKILKQTITEREREIKRLKRVCQKNARRIENLERMLEKNKKWYHFILWNYHD